MLLMREFLVVVSVERTMYVSFKSALTFTTHPAGNNCIFEYNYLHDLCYEVTDSGAFYTGRSWILRGNIIRYSHFANVQTTEKTYLGSPSVQAIYLDDQVYIPNWCFKLQCLSFLVIIIIMIDEWIHYS